MIYPLVIEERNAVIREYQWSFSQKYQDAAHNRKLKENKAQTICAVIENHVGKNLQDLSVLDVGASTGTIADYLSGKVRYMAAVDIDAPAIEYAAKTYSSPNLDFLVGDAMNLSFGSHTFDVVICAHVYEHVPSAQQMTSEVYRVLKNGGICYFAAGNKFQLMEPHYRLPFLSLMPRQSANLYLKFTRKGDNYYEKHLTYWELREILRPFEIIDYTSRIIKNPTHFRAQYMIRPGSKMQKIAQFVATHAYWAVPTYIWLLKKTR